MKAFFIKEQKRYYKNELVNLLELKPEEEMGFIRKLKSFGVLKMVKATSEEKELSELLDENVELVNDEENTDNFFYVFTYVGVLTIGKRVLKCYPKYIQDTEPHDKMRQVLHVLRKYNAREQIIALHNGEGEDTAFNLLAIMLYLLEEYAENGVYSNEQVVIEKNGMGEILWDNTINETYALISNNRPIYVDLQTVSVDEDEQDFFRRLHCSIVTYCFNTLEQAGLDKLFDINRVDVSNEEISDFGDDEYILYRLQKELDIQFNDRKKLLLKTIYTLISHRKAFESGVGISMFGTNSFNLVWEKVCAVVFENKLHTKVCELMQESGNDYYDPNTATLIEFIEKPKWRYKNSEYVTEQAKTLTPDLISIYPYEDDYCFAILDAKYYMIKLTEHSVKGHPGIGDVTKQYLYQMAYQDFVEKSNYKYIQNIFLVPGDEERGEFLGSAEFEMMKMAGREPLEHISIIKLPVQLMYKTYLSGNTDNKPYELLKLAPVRKLGINSFTYRMANCLNKRRLLHKAFIKADRQVVYPEEIRGDIGAKLLFDIIAPEVERHSYVYSPYKNEQPWMVADSFSDISMEKKILYFIKKIIEGYLDYSVKKYDHYEGAVEWVDNMIVENEFTVISEKAVDIAEVLWTLYRE